MNRLLEYTPDMEFLDPTSALSRAGVNQKNEHAAMAFGAGLLEVGNDAELEHFLTDLVSFVSTAADNTVGAPLRKSLVRVLGRAARHLLSIGSTQAALAIDTQDDHPDPHIRAARIFGLELEGLSPEDKEFEIAQQFIRLARDTIRNAIGPSALASHPRNLQARVEAALQQAAHHHAPGLLKVDGPATSSEGRWQRQGRCITVFDC
jgi:hypothetical protein